jgi:lipopolysaccharide/colanic/teichoic acid biosynthesis glycosyltransferase
MGKRVFDIVVSLAVITTVLLPLMVVVACIHRRYARGPLFFRQDRLGENGKVFEVIKFRTMKVNNDCEDRQASSADPRIFRGGGRLRKLSIDEFPQFLNVLRGDMSVVGPRPHLEIHERRFEQFYERYGMRRFVKPGVTGLAQIRGYRGEVKNPKDIRGRGRYDLIYVRNWSLALDFKIVLLTAMQVVRPHDNAY